MKEYEFNPNDIEHCLERADALKAKDEGETVQCMDNQDGEWIPRAHAHSSFVPEYRYRRNPTPVARPWGKPSDVPGPVCWIRLKDRNHACSSLEAMLISVSCEGFECNTNNVKFVAWQRSDLIEKLEYSTDRVNWLPCTTLEP